MINKIWVRLYIASQKCYGKNNIRYIFKTQKDSDLLLVVFSGFSGANEPARYNYIRTLLPVKANKLFILDDFGYQNQGGYYLIGRQGDDTLPEEICSLIEKLRGNKKLVTIGTSKGGTAALLYGLTCGADAVIAGAPQYHLGTYLTEPDHLAILEGICGNTSKDSVQKLDNLLPNQVQHGKNSNMSVFVHCAVQDHTFEEHVKDMVSDLEKQGYAVHKDLDNRYADHSSVGRYFPEYLINVLKKLMQKHSDH